MPIRMETSIEGEDFLAGHEGEILQSYDDATGKVVGPGDHVAGTLTIGIGHTRNVYKGQRITKAESRRLLDQDLRWAEGIVNREINVPLKQNQFDALVAHTFNTGGSEGLFKRVNNQASEEEIRRWWTTTWVTMKVNGKRVYKRGLQNRRNAEADLYFSGSYKNYTAVYALVAIVLITAFVLWYYSRKNK